MDNSKHEIVEKLQASNNILVTVSSNPSVDQLAACIGLTLLLNKLEKHATAVFSGQIPSTIEFLKPEDTIEKNTDSLRDFIIALDKSKADKLRYKVEDKVVKIFITPYRTSLSSEDLNFSQGDFNIDVVLALGVHQQTDLDQAITSHGRILHDATVACINTTPNGELGTVNWSKTDASSLSELVVELEKSFGEPLLDQQISTALLTGIVAETDRFRNEKTTANTMSLSAELMAAGANQQLVAKELEHEIDIRGKNHDEPQKESQPQSQAPADDTAPDQDDGTLEIDHLKETVQAPLLEEQVSEPEAEDQPTLPAPTPPQGEPEAPPAEDTSPPAADPSRSLITEAPTLGGRLTANTSPEEAHLDPSIDPLAGSMGSKSILQRTEQAQSKAPTVQPLADSAKDQQLPEPMMMPAPAAPAPEPPSSRPAPTPPAPQPMPMPERPQPAPKPAAPPAPQPAPTTQPQQAPPAPPKPASLTEREEPAQPGPSVDEVEKARQEVLRAISEQVDTNLPPVQALNAQPVELGRRNDEPPVPGGGQLSPPNPPAPQMPQPLPPNAPDLAPFANSPADQPLTMPMPPGVKLPPPQTTPPTNAPNQSPNSPPQVPPPMMPPMQK